MRLTHFYNKAQVLGYELERYSYEEERETLRHMIVHCLKEEHCREELNETSCRPDFV